MASRYSRQQLPGRNTRKALFHQLFAAKKVFTLYVLG